MIEWRCPSFCCCAFTRLVCKHCLTAVNIAEMLLILKRLRMHKKNLKYLCMCAPVVNYCGSQHRCVHVWLSMIIGREVIYTICVVDTLQCCELVRACVSVCAHARALLAHRVDTAKWFINLALAPLFVCVCEWVTAVAVLDDWGCVHICVIIVVNRPWWKTSCLSCFSKKASMKKC